jgi:hypothetical protein
MDWHMTGMQVWGGSERKDRKGRRANQSRHAGRTQGITGAESEAIQETE